LVLLGVEVIPKGLWLLLLWLWLGLRLLLLLEALLLLLLLLLEKGSGAARPARRGLLRLRKVVDEGTSALAFGPSVETRVDHEQGFTLARRSSLIWQLVLDAAVDVQGL
jgi:hypothetical protein